MNKLLVFYAADQKPTIDSKNKTALLYNHCDGYHLAEWICFNDDGSFEGFYDFMMNRFNDDFYVSWAILPQELLP